MNTNGRSMVVTSKKKLKKFMLKKGKIQWQRRKNADAFFLSTRQKKNSRVDFQCVCVSFAIDIKTLLLSIEVEYYSS